MATAAGIRTKLENKIFSSYGKTVTLKSKSSPTYNTRGEEESQTFTDSSITIVPYNMYNNRTSHQPFGELKSGEYDAAVPYDVTINKEDLITMDSEDWTVREIEQNQLQGLNVVTIIRMSRTQE